MFTNYNQSSKIWLTDPWVSELMNQKEIDTWDKKEPEKLNGNDQKMIVVDKPEDSDAEWLSKF